MASHNELGKEGEKQAMDYLQKKGYEILDTNWTFQKAEIDIIAQKDNILAIIEVKTRSSVVFGLPQDFVKPKKIQLLIKAVNAYVELNNITNEIRFDIIGIVYSEKSKNSNKNAFEIEHFEDAFYYF